MEIIYPENATKIKQESAAAVGFFDGVHKGHRYLIEQLKTNAGLRKLPTSIVTFSTHPKKILHGDFPPCLLNSLDERLYHLDSAGIDYCYLFPFTEEFSKLTAGDFIREILDKQLKIKFLLIGYDHKFGRGRNEGFEHYVEFGKTCGMAVEQAGAFSTLPGASFGSTAIRHFLQEGNVRQAAEMLSYFYTLDGTVISGDRLGRTIGFPTANLELSEKDKLIPKNGVYAGNVTLCEEKHRGMIYIGRRPTFSPQGEVRIEAHILNFNKTVYGEKMQIELTDFLRPDISFRNPEELRAQLEKDRKSLSENVILSPPLLI
ncbi:MAG: bifunctional riboflavin kinase/FAD synthetase [Candidatus Symbiothrix sp.]|jgi:riboflavin kinase/FMN adenylyltransferase|nr:bifunctional riboflavin kinase/FAD synthetase [Candidatus Symbiothrix sp.]